MAEEKERRRIGSLAITSYIIFGLAFILILIAFATPNWLASDERLYGARFVKLGLWEQCFRSIANPETLYENTYFLGCRWLFSPWTKDYDVFRDAVILQPFFVAVQTLYTLSFVLVLVGAVLVIMFGLCCPPDYYKLLFVTSLDLLIAAILGTMAVIIFGARGDGRDWMPDPDHNFLSWSFGLAVVGVYFLWVASLLFFIQAKRIRKEEEKQEGEMYPGPRHSKA